MAFWITSIGILGVTLIGVNFILEASDFLGKDHYTFILLHLTGSILLLAYSSLEKIPLFIILNSILVVVSLYELLKNYRKNKQVINP